MSNHNPHKKVSYTDLQDGIDNLLSEYGLPQAVRMINGLCYNTKIIHNAAYRYQLIKDYIIGEAILIFELDKTQFLNCEVREYREARMACYHILSGCVKDSHSGIAAAFGRKRGSIQYNIRKCNEMLSLPESHRAFVSRYKALESKTIQFIANLK